jgi:hypothetical protein
MFEMCCRLEGDGLAVYDLTAAVLEVRSERPQFLVTQQGNDDQAYITRAHHCLSPSWMVAMALSNCHANLTYVGHEGHILKLRNA